MIKKFACRVGFVAAVVGSISAWGLAQDSAPASRFTKKMSPVPRWIPANSKTSADHPPQFYLGQPTQDKTLELNATNGFFDRCFVAVEPQNLPAEDWQSPLIRQSFASLVRVATQPNIGTARWHLWFAKTGDVEAEFHVRLPPQTAPHRWTIHLGDQRKVIDFHSGSDSEGSRARIRFTKVPSGYAEFSIQCDERQPAVGAHLQNILLDGTAIEDARLLRARWRPSAIHLRFVPSHDPEQFKPKVWVFETRSMNTHSSYSPLTTPFGYFGTSFKQGGVEAGAGFNFSMWIAGRNAQVAPPISETPHLIATGIPKAVYSFFGHEGTGVKFREAVAYPHGANRVIQAMRVEFDEKENADVFYGYFYNESQANWILYASGKKPAKARRAEEVRRYGTLRSTGSFCEIPGPPSRERSGDRERMIERRGWFLGDERQACRAKIDTRGDGQGERAKWTSKIQPEGDFSKSLRDWVNKSVGYTPDYSLDGWIAMATGGLKFGPSGWINDFGHAGQMGHRVGEEDVPEYLAPEKIDQLWEVPIEMGNATVGKVTPTGATLHLELKKTGVNSRGTLWYGTRDAVVFTPQTIRQGSAVLKDLFRQERTWQYSTGEQKGESGWNTFDLTDLKPATQYHFRLFVRHEEGQGWADRSGTFMTR